MNTNSKTGSLRIVIVSPWTHPSVGGTQTLVHAIASELSKIPFVSICVVTSQESLTGIYSLSVESLNLLYPIIRLPIIQVDKDFFNLNNRNFAENNCFENGFKVLKMLKADIILYTPHNTGFAYQACLAAKEIRATFVMWPAIHLDNKKHTSESARVLYRICDLLISNSIIEENWLVNIAGVNRERVITLGCGFNKSLLEREKTSRTANFDEELKLLSIGQLKQHKRFIDQIQTIKILKEYYGLNAQLIITGAAFDHTCELARKISAYRMEHEIKIITNCDEQILQGLYTWADIFLFTSTSESFGIALLDAIASGTYPVVYPHPVYSAFVRSSGYGEIADDCTPVALARAVLRAKNNIRSKVCYPSITQSWLHNRTWRSITHKLWKALFSFSSMSLNIPAF